MREFSSLCREIVGAEVPITEDASTGPVDIPWYITDHGRVTAAMGWEPRRRPREIVEDIARWVRANEVSLSRVVV